MRFDGFTREDEQRFIDLTKDGVTAIFIYTDKLVVNGERTAYKKDRTVVFSGEIYAPVSLFTDFLGVSCTECDNGAVLEFSGKKDANGELLMTYEELKYVYEINEEKNTIVKASKNGLDNDGTNFVEAKILVTLAKEYLIPELPNLKANKRLPE